MYADVIVLWWRCCPISGRNMALCLRSRAGFVKSTAVIGMTMFLQHWYWYPYLHFISLALAPTAVIGVTKDLSLPVDFAVTCNTKPSEFAYVRARLLAYVICASGIVCVGDCYCLYIPDCFCLYIAFYSLSFISLPARKVCSAMRLARLGHTCIYTHTKHTQRMPLLLVSLICFLLLMWC
jgi:hypothetical protein